MSADAMDSARGELSSAPRTLINETTNGGGSGRVSLPAGCGAGPAREATLPPYNRASGERRGEKPSATPDFVRQRRPRKAPADQTACTYAELATATNFSFLHGASHPADLVARALLLGHSGIGIADRNTVAGVVQAYGALEDLRRDGLPAPQKIRDGSGPGEHLWLEDPNAADWAKISDEVKSRAASFKLVVGARLVFADGTPDIIAYPRDREGWAQLCRLLTLGKRRADKGDCHITLADLAEVLRTGHDVPAGDGDSVSNGEAIASDRDALPHLTLIVIPPPRLGGVAEQVAIIAAAVWAATTNHAPSTGSSDRLCAGAEVSLDIANLKCGPSFRPRRRATRPASSTDAARADESRNPAQDSCGTHAASIGDIQEFKRPSDNSCARSRISVAALPSSGMTVQNGFWNHTLWIATAMHLRGDDHRRLAQLDAIARTANIPLLAVNDVLYDTPAQRPIQDVLTCIREGLTLETAGRRLEMNAERHLKSTAEMTALFRDAPAAIAATQTILDGIRFSLGELKYEYPDEPVAAGYTPQAWLAHLTWEKARARYGDALPEKVETSLRTELALIEQLKYAPYFLTIYDIVRYAREQGILCQGRGSAANSAVCYVLGITSVDPAEHNLLFARFISSERREPPDIDVDFEHERREEVIQHIYERYGRERAGIVATVIRYRPRSAIREVGKVLGLSEDVTGRIAGTVWGSWGSSITRQHLKQAGLDPDNPIIHRAITLATRILGFPRHLSQHVGGFVLTRGRLDELAPIGNAAMEDRTFIEWDKDDIDTLGLMKVDVLALGMLTCIRKAFDLMRAHEGVDLELDRVPAEQPDVYAMLQKGDSVGVFQVESRAQMNMLPRLKPEEFYDLVIQVAIVRPGPIQGDMVHPYLRRRSGAEDITYPSPAPPHDADELRNILSRTKGVPLFQEQAMQLAMVAAEFTDAEANQLRRAMATFRNVGTIHKFEALLVERMVARGYERAFAQRCFEQIKGFGEYGFPESHAASFAKLVYISSFIKCRYPAVFACALLNAQPMGFYAPAQIVRDAREHGVEVYPVDVNASDWDNTLCLGGNGATALRLGFRQLDGVREEWCQKLIDARGNGFSDVDQFARKTHLPQRALRLFADADCFQSMGIDRRNALWAARRIPDDEPLPLFAAAREAELAEEPDAHLPDMPMSEHVAADYQTAHLSVKGHPMAFLRDVFRAEGIVSCAEAVARRDGAWTRVAGVVLVRQRPGKGNAIFMTLEDESGILNTVLWARQFEKFRREVMGARLMVVEGRIQRSHEGIVHLMVTRVLDRTSELVRLSEDHATKIELAPADEFLNPQHPRRHPRDVRILPKSRDFH